MPVPVAAPPASGLWVLVGLTSADPTLAQAATSPDLTTWTLENLNFSSDATAEGVGFFDGAFIAWSSAGDISVRNPLTQSWDKATNPIGIILAMGVSAGGRIVAIDSAGKSAYSDSAGETWTEGNGLGGVVTVQATVTYGDGKFLAVTVQAGQAFPWTSPDGITFAKAVTDLQAGGPVYLTVFGNGTFLVLGCDSDNSFVWTSPDALTFTEQSAPAGGFPKELFNADLIFDGANFFMGSNGTPFFWLSPDGVNFTGVDDNDTIFQDDIIVIANNGTTLYLAVDNDIPPNVASSPSAAAWVSTQVFPPLNARISGAAFGST